MQMVSPTHTHTHTHTYSIHPCIHLCMHPSIHPSAHMHSLTHSRTPIAHLSGSDGVCKPFGKVVVDKTKYEYFKTTFYSNSRNAYQSASHLQIDMRATDDFATDVQKCQKKYGEDAFRCFVGNTWCANTGGHSQGNIFQVNSRTLELILRECKSSGTITTHTLFPSFPSLAPSLPPSLDIHTF